MFLLLLCPFPSVLPLPLPLPLPPHCDHYYYDFYDGCYTTPPTLRRLLPPVCDTVLCCILSFWLFSWGYISYISWSNVIVSAPRFFELTVIGLAVQTGFDLSIYSEVLLKRTECWEIWSPLHAAHIHQILAQKAANVHSLKMLESLGSLGSAFWSSSGGQ